MSTRTEIWPMQSASERQAPRAPVGSDRDKLDRAIEEFRTRGYWARSGQQDGWKAVPEDILRSGRDVVFWHKHEHVKAFDLDGRLLRALHMRHFVADTQEIERVFKTFGLVTSIDSDPLGGVVVLPQSERP